MTTQPLSCQQGRVSGGALSFIYRGNLVVGFGFFLFQCESRDVSHCGHVLSIRYILFPTGYETRLRAKGH